MLLQYDIFLGEFELRNWKLGKDVRPVMFFLGLRISAHALPSKS